ncbi:MAG TPA: exopolyphosphatase [Vicinamibacterales bacterium]|nr:exopolyphosphatase [Vicinamibacterales bacterium]
MPDTYRLVTRSDFDGVASAALLKKKGVINDILFVHPKDVQDGKVEITPNDITTNVPYSPNAHIAFDHHASETVRIGGKTPANLVLDPDAPSAVHVVYRHYGGKTAFPNVSEGLLEAVDKVDSARLTKDEILNPPDWVLLGFLMDARTGLGRFRSFAISNYQLMSKLVDAIANLDVKDILKLPDVAERVALYREHQEPAKAQLQKCAKVHGNLVEIDLRNEETIYATNRFLLYALFPNTNISMHVMWGRGNQNVVFAIGKSILNRTSKTNIGSLCLKYGGGGHEAAGTCQVDADKAMSVREELIKQINKDG